MSKYEIKGVYHLSPTFWMRTGLNIKEKLWWAFMPGEVFTVKWPIGKIVVDDTMRGWDPSLGARLQEITSTDPNDHYRPWLESNVGRQGRDWDWGILENSCACDYNPKLTIKIRQKYAKCAIMAALQWS